MIIISINIIMQLRFANTYYHYFYWTCGQILVHFKLLNGVMKCVTNILNHNKLLLWCIYWYNTLKTKYIAFNYIYSNHIFYMTYVLNIIFEYLSLDFFALCGFSGVC